MAQWPPGFTRISPPPLRWSFRPPPPLPSDEKTSSQGRIIAGIFIGMVTSLLVFTIVCSLCRGHQNRRARAAAAAAALRPRLPLPERRVRHDERHLRRACAASPTTSLPAFTYSRSVKHNVTGEGEEAVPCSVCLGAFQLGETVRLLPVCLHLYHVECIDPWLDEHSTCPLCRSDTDPSSRVPPA